MGQLYLIQVVGAVGGGSPDQGLPGGGGYPDQGLPGQPPGIWPRPPSAGHLPAWPGRPVDPGFGVPGGGSPGHLPAPQPPGIWPNPPGGSAGQLPGYHPDQGLPGGGAGVTPHYGVVPPEKPASVDPNKGAWVLVLVGGSAYWAWAQASASGGGERPDQGLPPGGGGERPDQGLPPRPDQGLPPGQPGAPDQGLPPGTTPPTTKPNPVPTPQRR